MHPFNPCLKLTQARSEIMQLVSWIALTSVAAGGVYAVMLTASIVISALINICAIEDGGKKLHQSL